MSKTRSFIFAWVVTTSIFTANMFVGANEQKNAEEQKAAASEGAVTVDGCKVTANLSLQEDGVRTVVTASNPTDGEVTVKLNYLVQSMPQTSPFSRMMVIPQMRKQGTCSLTLAAGESKEETIVVAPKTELEDLSNSGTWTFAVSRSEITAPMFGASSATVAPGLSSLTEGTAVLAALQLTAEPAINMQTATPANQMQTPTL